MKPDCPVARAPGWAEALELIVFNSAFNTVCNWKCQMRKIYMVACEIC